MNCIRRRCRWRWVSGIQASCKAQKSAAQICPWRKIQEMCYGVVHSKDYREAEVPKNRPSPDFRFAEANLLGPGNLHRTAEKSQDSTIGGLYKIYYDLEKI